MIPRSLEATVRASLRRFPVVALVGARQVGKTTLARRLLRRMPGQPVLLDLERPSDLAKIAEPELYLEPLAGKLVVLDEVQQVPGLFRVLRALVDARRQPGRFLLLGSASPDLLRQSAESLAGRVVYHELAPFALHEVGNAHAARLWLRGGFPGSFLARSESASLAWREAFIATHLERDLPQLGIRVPASNLRRFWLMLAHSHGQLWNASKVGASLGLTAPTMRHYLDILSATFMVRELPPYHPNLKKRLVKTPKVYIRDSGILHGLLGLKTRDEVLAHPVCGTSWEGWVIEQILALAPRGMRASFYRTGAGAEVDLIVELPAGSLLGFEIKRSAAPRPSKGLLAAMEDLGLAKAYVVCPVRERFALGPRIQATPVGDLPRLLGAHQKIDQTDRVRQLDH
jgi:predicted AAA+ superfamily ATPase